MGHLLPVRNQAARSVPRPLAARLVRYGVVGLASTALYFLMVAGLVELGGWDPALAAVLACTVTIVLAYGLNYRWVFASARRHGAAFPSFVAATFVSLSLNDGIMYVSVHVLGWWYGLGLLITTAVVPPTNFVLNYLWCFRPDEDKD